MHHTIRPLQHALAQSPVFMKRLFVFLLLISGSALLQQANAQHHYFETAYIIQKRDTLYGLIDRVDELSLSQAVYFKPAPEAEAVRYTPADLQGFGFSKDNHHFVAVQVSLRKASVSLEVARFAKQLLKGHMNLYRVPLLKDEKENTYLKNNDFVFVVNKEEQFYTLAQYEFQLEGRVGVNKRYIGTLRSLTSGCPEITQEKLDRLSFVEEEMISLISRYNLCMNPAENQPQYAWKVKSQIRHGAKISYGKIMSGTTGRLITSSHAYSIGYFWDVTKPEQSRKFSQNLGVNYSYLHYGLYDRHHKESTQADMHLIRIPLLIQYNFNAFTATKYKTYIQAGLSPQLSTNSTFNYIDIIPFVSLGAGVYTRKFNYFLALDNLGLSPRSHKIISLGIGWRLDKEQHEKAEK